MHATPSVYSPGSAAPNLEADIEQRSDSCYLSRHHQRGHSVRASDPEHRYPQVPDNGGEQDEESSVVPPQTQEGWAGMPSLLGDQSGNEDTRTQLSEELRQVQEQIDTLQRNANVTATAQASASRLYAKIARPRHQANQAGYAPSPRETRRPRLLPTRCVTQSIYSEWRRKKRATSRWRTSERKSRRRIRETGAAQQW
ncbi:hypothetical protein N657DRAFT_161305 [Parathielavia appendiculata]|uniref:Uncharacterized protein n=1 Tax=Parathielavia appendiculata TaxID=2587402 RepID=A0AAN6TTK7_9PEZI|nr:hypothetical protein N657DRAFT_161305 [Parathielavia appendiculata]